MKAISLLVLTFVSISVSGQSSEIEQLAEKNAYRYTSYYSNGNIESIVGFYSRKPYSSIEEFEEDLNGYKVKYHGARKEFYESGQLKEIVVYEKGKVVEFSRTYFEDGEEYDVVTDELPKFQFDVQAQGAWFSKKIKEIESKYGVSLEGQGLIALEISKSGEIKAIFVRVADEAQEKYLREIAEQIQVVEPAKKDGQSIGTRFAFRIQLK